MPNIAGVLKEEICRLAKKEAKAATTQLQRASVQYRSDIAKLKKLVGQQSKEIVALRKKEQPQAVEESDQNIRFSARSVKAQRQRTALSAANYAKLVGVSEITIYNWESGKTKPQKAQLDALAAVRGIGKREALKKLEEIG